MKKNEIALLILIVGLSFGASFFTVQALFGGEERTSVEVQTMEAISGDVVQPESRIFNDQAINPTVEASIGEPSNQQPLGN